MSEVILRLPGPDAPGFLKRMREVQAIKETGNGISIIDMWLKFGDWLIDHGYVEAPEGVDPREALDELSQADMSRALFALAGVDIPKTVPPPNGG